MIIFLKIIFVILNLCFLFTDITYDKEHDKGIKMWIILELLILWVIV